MNKQEFDYVIVGAGIAGCSLAHFLSKYSQSVLLIDKNEDVAFGASGAAGAFLSPLLGKPNDFKDLVTKALNFSIDYYKKNFSEELQNFGTCRIPKNQEDEEKFQTYIPYMDFEYEKFELNNPTRYWWTNGFDPKWYLSPFPSTEVNKGYGLVQNPGW